MRPRPSIRAIYSKCPCEPSRAILDPSYKAHLFPSEAEALAYYYSHTPDQPPRYECIHVAAKGCLRLVLNGTCPIDGHRNQCSCPVRSAHLT